MATSTLFISFVSLLLHAALTLPISQDLESVPSEESKQAVKQSERTLVLNPYTIQRHGEDIDSVIFDRALKRTKRDLIKGNHGCAEGMVWFKFKCVTLEEYDELKEDDYEES